jgi:hypothetical protein|tara:strand:+ start:235 stop:363 length:129 start_codon:yes stop_codon:yes gene_type:complete
MTAADIPLATELAFGFCVGTYALWVAWRGPISSKPGFREIRK